MGRRMLGETIKGFVEVALFDLSFLFPEFGAGGPKPSPIEAQGNADGIVFENLEPSSHWWGVVQVYLQSAGKCQGYALIAYVPHVRLEVQYFTALNYARGVPHKSVVNRDTEGLQKPASVEACGRPHVPPSGPMVCWASV